MINKRRPRGRPLSPRAHQAALRAALEIISTVGLRDLTIEAVAERAGISRSTFYRHWTAKEDLILEALSVLNANVSFSLTGDVRTDFVRIGKQIIEAGLASMGQEQGLARAIGEGVYDPRYKQLIWHQFIVPRRAAIARMFEEGQRRGVLRPDLDVELILDVVAGAFHYILRANPSPRDLGSVPEEVVDLLWRGIAANPILAAP